MLALLVLLSASSQPPLVAVRPNLEARCPSSVEVEAALLARVPGVVVAFDRAIERQALVLSLTVEKAVVDLVLTDAESRVRLRRSLAGAGETRSCAALAETAALMVERYLVELDERSAAAPALPPLVLTQPPDLDPEPADAPFAIAVGIGALATSGRQALDASVRASRLFGRRRNFAASLRVGVGPAFNPVPAGLRWEGVTTARRFPLQAGVNWRHPALGGAFEAGGGLGLDFHQIHAEIPGSPPASDVLTGPHAAFETAFELPVSSHFFVRLGVGALVNFIRYQISRGESGGSTPPAFALPSRRIHARLTLEIGMPLPVMKNGSPGP